MCIAILYITETLNIKKNLVSLQILFFDIQYNWLWMNYCHKYEVWTRSRPKTTRDRQNNLNMFQKLKKTSNNWSYADIRH